MKIVSSGGTISTETYLAKKRQVRRKKLIIWGSALILLLGLLIFLSRLEYFQVREVNVSGAEATSPDSVVLVAKDLMSEKYLWLVPKSNALVYPEDFMREILFRKFPRFSSVDFSLSGLNTLNISVIEREPFALYCGASAQGGELSQCYFLDEVGFIFDHAPSFSEGVYFVYSASEPFSEPLGQAYLSADEFTQLRDFIEELKTLGIKPIALEMTPEVFILRTENDSSLSWLRSTDLTRLLGNLKAFLSSPEIKAEKGFLEKFEELDLRTEDKVFYRFKN